MKQGIKKLIIKFRSILNFINNITPKKKNRIVLYSNLGFRDNVEALYRYLVKHKYNLNYQIVCSTDEWKKYKKLKQLDNVKFVDCYTGVYYYLTSKYFFYCFGKYPIMPSKRQCVINLWHGMPLKRIGKLEKGEEETMQNYFTYVLATSEFFKRYLFKAFGCSMEQIIISGLPRNDDLFNTDIDIKNYFSLPLDCKTICYMPTFRKSERIGLNNYTIDNCLYEKLKTDEILKILNETLKKFNIFMFIKPHPMDDFNENTINNFDNLIFLNEKKLNEKKLNTYQFLGNVDALITDYSSVYFDYLLLDKPIGYIIDDIESYKTIRGFIVDEPEKIMPGHKIKTLNDLFIFIRDLKIGTDAFKLEREILNNLVNDYKGTKSTANLLEILQIKN